MNWHKKELKLWVIQNAGGGQPWSGDWNKAAEQFFAQPMGESGVDAYTGRLK